MSRLLRLAASSIINNRVVYTTGVGARTNIVEGLRCTEAWGLFRPTRVMETDHHWRITQAIGDDLERACSAVL
jgi:hypothetical protein